MKTLLLLTAICLSSCATTTTTTTMPDGTVIKVETNEPVAGAVDAAILAAQILAEK